MATPGHATDRARRLRAIAEAAAVLTPGERRSFLDALPDIEPAFRAEVELLAGTRAALAPAPGSGRVQGQGGGERHDVVRLFELGLALAADDRRPFLDAIRGATPALSSELESLLKHATSREGPLDQDPWTGDNLPDPMIGRRIGPHEILRKLGEGGMGVVYLAVDTRLGKQVAVKMLRPEYSRDPDLRVRLVNEARAAASVSHASVASVFLLHEEGPDLFIVSEFVDGPTLRHVVHHGPLAYQRVARIFTEVAKGLAAAHARGIIHRDLKPENIMLAEGDQPKIVDFGLAKSSEAIRRSTTMMSHDSRRAGTPAYMAPEQIEGRPLDFRADHFAFGITLFECATGVNPFEGTTLATTYDNILHRDPPKLKKPGTNLDALDVIVERCLRKAPEQRYEKTSDLVRALEDLAPVPPPSRPDPLPHPPLWWWRLHQVNVSLLQGAALIWLWFAHKLIEPRGLGLLLFLLMLVPTVAAVVLRLLLWFGSFDPASREFARLRRQLRPWIRGADVVFVATLTAMAGRFLWQDRPGTATPMLIAALVYLVTMLVIEPFTNERAFGKYTCPTHRDVQHDGPGACPKCGAHLVKRDDDADA